MKNLFIALLLIIIAIVEHYTRSTYAVNIAILPLVPLIAGGLSVVSSAFGSSAGAKEAKKNEKILKGLQDENQSNYISEYYRGSLDNPGSRAYLKRLDENIRDKTKATENTAVATGATQENVLAQKQANNEVYSNAVGGLVQNEDERKQRVKQNYFSNKTSLAGSQMGINSQKAQNWMNIAGGISQAAGSLASLYLQGNNTGLFKPIQAGSSNIAGNVINYE